MSAKFSSTSHTFQLNISQMLLKFTSRKYYDEQAFYCIYERKWASWQIWLLIINIKNLKTLQPLNRDPLSFSCLETVTYLAWNSHPCLQISILCCISTRNNPKTILEYSAGLCLVLVQKKDSAFISLSCFSFVLWMKLSKTRIKVNTFSATLWASEGLKQMLFRHPWILFLADEY